MEDTTVKGGVDVRSVFSSSLGAVPRGRAELLDKGRGVIDGGVGTTAGTVTERKQRAQLVRRALALRAPGREPARRALCDPLGGCFVGWGSGSEGEASGTGNSNGAWIESSGKGGRGMRGGSGGDADEGDGARDSSNGFSFSSSTSSSASSSSFSSSAGGGESDSSMANNEAAEPPFPPSSSSTCGDPRPETGADAGALAAVPLLVSAREMSEGRRAAASRGDSRPDDGATPITAPGGRGTKRAAIAPKRVVGQLLEAAARARRERERTAAWRVAAVR